MPHLQAAVNAAHCAQDRDLPEDVRNAHGEIFFYQLSKADDLLARASKSVGDALGRAEV